MCMSCHQIACTGATGCVSGVSESGVVAVSDGFDTVRDYTALLAYVDYPQARFNALLTDPGDAVFVSVRFLEDDQLPPLEDVSYDPTAVWSFNAAQRASARAAMAHLSAQAGVVFVETASDDAMINFHGASAPQWAGWANYPWVHPSQTNTGTLVMNRTDAFSPGSSTYEVLLHELGHAVGLKHPFEGALRLAADLDNKGQTLMSYTRAGAVSSTFSPLDIEALQHLYGAPRDMAGWSWQMDGPVFDLKAGNGSDTLIGLRNPNRIDGGGGDDLILGGQNADTLAGGNGHDTLRGGPGANLLIGGAGDDVIEGNEIFRAGIVNETVWGGAGDDIITLSLGNNTVWAGPGSDHVLGGSGTDTLGGGAGDDRIEARQGSGNELWGGTGNDTLLASDSGWYPQGDRAGGGAGNDVFLGMAGNDSAYGGAGNDTLRGEAGQDALYLGVGNDSAHGGAGNDTLYAGPGFDRLWGDAGADRFEFWRGDGWNRVEDFVRAQGDVIALGSGMWRASHGVLTAAQVVQAFGRVTAAGDAVLDFAAADTVVVIVGAGTLAGLPDALILI